MKLNSIFSLWSYWLEPEYHTLRTEKKTFSHIILLKSWNRRQPLKPHTTVPNIWAQELNKRSLWKDILLSLYVRVSSDRKWINRLAKKNYFDFSLWILGEQSQLETPPERHSKSHSCILLLLAFLIYCFFPFYLLHYANVEDFNLGTGFSAPLGVQTILVLCKSL